MAGRVIAIGDIHGCSRALDALVEAIAPAADDTLVMLGDYCDRGPDTRGVIERLLELQASCQLIPLLGNHEQMMMDVVLAQQPPYDWLKFGGVDTLDSYGFSGDLGCIPPSHLEFLSQLRDYYETETHFFVHANYLSDVPLDEQPTDVLRWLKLTQELPGPHINGKQAVVGHTHDRAGEIFSVGHLVCIDTYCYGGGWLTAMDVNDQQLWQADASGNLRELPV